MIFYNRIWWKSFEFCLSHICLNSWVMQKAFHSYRKPQQTYTAHVTIPQTHEQTPPPKYHMTSPSPGIYMAPPPTSAPYSSQAQHPAPLISPGIVRPLCNSKEKRRGHPDPSVMVQNRIFHLFSTSDVQSINFYQSRACSASHNGLTLSHASHVPSCTALST